MAEMLAALANLHQNSSALEVPRTPRTDADESLTVSQNGLGCLSVKKMSGIKKDSESAARIMLRMHAPAVGVEPAIFGGEPMGRFSR